MVEAIPIRLHHYIRTLWITPMVADSKAVSMTLKCKDRPVVAQVNGDRRLYAKLYPDWLNEHGDPIGMPLIVVLLVTQGNIC